MRTLKEKHNSIFNRVVLFLESENYPLIILVLNLAFTLDNFVIKMFCRVISNQVKTQSNTDPKQRSGGPIT